MSPFAQLANVINSVMMRSSTVYHLWMRNRYWSTASHTHKDMSAEKFEFYAQEIRNCIGTPESAGLVLDHGAGRGEISIRLAAWGYRIEASEISHPFIQEMKNAGLKAFDVHDLEDGRYDCIFANNSIFYVHPRLLESEINRLLKKLRRGGRLILTDVPVVQKMDRLATDWLHQLIWRWTRVYQPREGGFFVDSDWLTHSFPRAIVRDSWCGYRSHFEIPA